MALARSSSSQSELSIQSCFSMVSESSYSDSRPAINTNQNQNLNSVGIGGDDLDFYLHDPICSGFLSLFCDNHLCSENMQFIMEIDRFKDFFHRDLKAFNRKRRHRKDEDEIETELIDDKISTNGDDKNVNILSVLNRLNNKENNLTKYTNINTQINIRHLESEFSVLLNSPNFISKENWPSEIINKDAVQAHLIYIWDTFMHQESKYWICLPYNLFISTLDKMCSIHIYGPNVFNDALLDPAKTIQKDIYPRFLYSQEFKLMKKYIEIIKTIPLARDFKYVPPRYAIVFKRYSLNALQRNDVRYTLRDLIDDTILFPEFMKYLQQVFSSENLLCVRAIVMFKESIDIKILREKNKGKKQKEEDRRRMSHSHSHSHLDDEKKDINEIVMENAWNVYRYFVAPSSPYEVSLAYHYKKNVMRSLANPTKNMFDEIENSALSALKTHYNNFLGTKQYAALNDLVLSCYMRLDEDYSLKPLVTVKGKRLNDKNPPKSSCFPF